ncbi:MULTISPECIES: DUF6705 family protein [Nonlabens]|uniref:DUF6705 domain-containing protein n=1 Tax=Nonlabens ulvanivorans TaxID=906888 RepID=A0A090Q6B4_NONUL|nr:DUF6705 family protein [Nonlabens ulvanivorans]GAK98629.1 hypothetical protein JCM19314_2660 [Nonlabens ulvanivorans]GAL73928.1 hypothetical protein JCM19275_2775 [Nonlabens ulvanivorans]
MYKLSVLLFFISINISFSQTLNEISLREINPNRLLSDEPDYTYFKDISGDLNKFLGNWVFDDGTNRLEINVVKNTQVPDDFNIEVFGNGHRYEDKLTVTYKFYQNSQLIYDIESNTSADYSTSINSNIIQNNQNIIGANSLDTWNIVQFPYYEPVSIANACGRSKIGQLSIVYDSTLVPDNNGNLQSGSLIWILETRDADYTLLTEKCSVSNPIYDDTDFLLPSNIRLLRD